MKSFGGLLAVICLSSISAFGALSAGGGGGGGHGGGGGGGAHMGGGAVHSGAFHSGATPVPKATAILGHGPYHGYGYYGGWGYYHGCYYPFYPYWDFYYYGYPAYYDYPPPPEYAPTGGQAYSPSGPTYEELGRFWGRKLKQEPASRQQFIAFLQSDVLKASEAGRQLFQGGFLKTYGKEGGPVLNHAFEEAKGAGETAVK